MGTLNVQVNPPLAFVTIVAPTNVPDPSKQPEGVRRPVPKVRVASPFGVNPVAVTSNPLPTLPWTGATTMVTVVTVKEVVADWPPTSLPVTTVPDVLAGTGTVQEKSPELFVTKEPLVHEEEGMVTESKTNDASAVETENPAPVAATGVPTGP